MNRKIIAAALIYIFLLLLCGCSKTEFSEKSGTLQIVCAGFAEYDWTRELIKGIDRAEVTYLADDGTDMHSFQPTVKDMVAVSECDVFIYSGGESYVWVSEMLDSISNEEMLVLELMQTPGFTAKIEEITEGMEAEEEEGGYDEHIWLSLKNAQIFCAYITDALIEKDPGNASLYDANHKAYAARLEQLDEAYQTAADLAEGNTMIFADRFPFRYLLEDYGLEAYAAFPGCSSETAASFKTVVFLAGKADELELQNIVVLKDSDRRLAETVVYNTADKNINIIVMDSMQNINSDMAENGCTYLSVMEENLQAVIWALAVKE